MDMITEATQVAQAEAQRSAASHPSAGHSAAHTPDNQGQAREFLTFRLGDEEYGIDILRVQEIRSYEKPTRIANAQSFLKGVVNLRGVIVPIVDLRLALGCAEAPYNNFTVVIVLNVGQRVIGAVVDSVSDVLALTTEQMRPAPDMSSGAVSSNHITGIGQAGDRMLILLDIKSLLSSPEMGLLDAQPA